MKYPHLSSKSDFPDVGGVDVFRFDNNFDYSRYDQAQMKLTICTVPWDMGEAHVGQRTISGIGNVVYFGSTDLRDAWFETLPDDECFRFTTKFKELHRDNSIVVPIPFNVASHYNYLAVEYSLFANDESPIEYEDSRGRKKWFWFIRECEFVAPNATKLHLLNDAWQTFIYDVDISEMILERGHAPLAAMDAGRYLADPLANCAGLLADDVDFSEASIVTDTETVIFNDGTIYAVVVSTANPWGRWGAKADDTWRVPSPWPRTYQGTPAYSATAMLASDFQAWFEGVYADIPQFFQTVKGVYFISEKLITLGTPGTWGGVSCYNVYSGYTAHELVRLDKDLFGYPERYADLAKLYTAPYAHLEISDEQGRATVVKIEDTRGTITANACVNLAIPWVNIDAHLSGIGSGSAQSLRFKNIGNDRYFPIQGNWRTFIQQWSVPVYSVIIEASTEYDYSTHFDRKQRARENATQQGNANRSAAAAQANQIANADTMVDNADLQQAYNTAITERVATLETLREVARESLNTEQTYLGIDYANATTNNDVEAKNRSNAISNAQGILTGTVDGAMSGAGSGGAAGAALGAVTGLLGGAINAHFASAQTAIAANLASSQTAASNNFNANMAARTNSYNGAITNSGVSQKRSDTSDGNDLIDGTTANTAATIVANAGRSYAAETGNAADTYATAQAGIASDVSQAALRAPFEFGTRADGSTDVTRPRAVMCDVVTQSPDAIAQAGDAFLRYGYAYNRRWDFNGDWCVMPNFTYWKLADFWISGLNVPDLYIDRLRFFLYGGVTVWRDPAKIGNVTIYDN